jgi:FKBP-type peptidyl-prolyl cis-trans isomerase
LAFVQNVQNEPVSSPIATIMPPMPTPAPSLQKLLNAGKRDSSEDLLKPSSNITTKESKKEKKEKKDKKDKKEKEKASKENAKSKENQATSNQNNSNLGVISKNLQANAYKSGTGHVREAPLLQALAEQGITDQVYK